MRSRRDDVDPWAVVERALRLGVCGLGGRLGEVPTTPAAAVRATSDEYDDRAAARLQRFAAAPVPSWVWTQEAPGVFRLGRITGPWRYDPTDAGATVDLVHLRPCTWDPRPFAEHELPPAVALTFRRGGRNFQRTHHPDVAAQTERIWTGEQD